MEEVAPLSSFIPKSDKPPRLKNDLCVRDNAKKIVEGEYLRPPVEPTTAVEPASHFEADSVKLTSLAQEEPINVSRVELHGYDATAMMQAFINAKRIKASLMWVTPDGDEKAPLDSYITFIEEYGKLKRAVELNVGDEVADVID
ncbi:hypothetical protein L7F22_020743, partial [Adiantum nelumboides]|nr:hypothetical protein [Adiantum nelumboides]